MARLDWKVLVLESFDGFFLQVFVDMTFGAGGHTRALLEKAPNARYFALDRDPEAHQIAQEFAKAQLVIKF